MKNISIQIKITIKISIMPYIDWKWRADRTIMEIDSSIYNKYINYSIMPYIDWKWRSDRTFMEIDSSIYNKYINYSWDEIM